MTVVPLAVLAGSMFWMFNQKFGELDEQANEKGVEVLVDHARVALSEAALEKITLIQEKQKQATVEVLLSAINDVEYLTACREMIDLAMGLKFYIDFGGTDEDGTVNTEDDTYLSIANDPIHGRVMYSCFSYFTYTPINSTHSLTFDS